MTGLQDELQRAKQREQIATWNRAEAALAAQLATRLPLPKVELDGDTLKHAQIFIAWCAERGVRHTPAKPATCASFILWHSGVGDERLLGLVSAVQKLHQLHSLSDPTRTPIVEKALAQVVQIEPPRSWNKSEKAEFLLLPVSDRAAIARRESQREKEIRRLQNATAEKLRQTNGAETKSVKLEKEMQNGEA